MKTKVTIFRTFLFSALLAVLMSGCEKSPADLSGELQDIKSNPTVTGTSYTIPNSFDGGGLLCYTSVTGGQPSGTPMELWMGVGNTAAGTLVGHVTFLSNPDRVRIDLTDLDQDGETDLYPYVLTAVHIHFAATVGEIPNTKGNPVPGQFEYNIPVDPYQTIIDVPVEFDAVGAIHLTVVKYGGIDGFNFYLPDNQVTLRIIDYPSAGDASYFKMKISDAGFISTYDMGLGAGIYEAWCIDVDHNIYLNKDYPAYLFSSYETLPGWMVGPGLIENPQNLKKVNYLVNNFAAGQMVQPLDAACQPVGDPQALTFSDIQRAIWHYLDDNQSTAGLVNWSQERVNAIICDVNDPDNNAEIFVPSCDQKIVFLVVPTGTNPEEYSVQIVIGQPVIAEIEVPCTTESGSAWGDGKYGAQFPGAKQWSTYFSTVCPSLIP